MLKKILNPRFLLILIIVLAVFLRLYKLSSDPPSLFGDELDLGYQAYSVLKTGHDYQGNLLPIHFHSMAEWRTPLYLYSAVPTVAVFGITPLGVRLPAAIFGILSVLVFYFLIKEILGKENLSLLGAFLMAVSPWSLQYSRAGFEVTQMLFLLLAGLWLFFKSAKSGRYLWISVMCLVLMPWVYSTAKLFTPLLIMFLFAVYRREILKIKRNHLINAVITGLVIGIPIAVSTLFGGGTQRIGNISVLKDPMTENTVNEARGLDIKVGVPPLESKLINNKFVYWSNAVAKNYLQTFSTDFLFLKGDLNMRQSVGWGMFYLFEIVALFVGFGTFFFGKTETKLKLLIGFWVLGGAIPAALTLNGGTHATRLFLILPPILLVISYGWLTLYNFIGRQFKTKFVFGLGLLYLIGFLFYAHQYYSVYPVVSERWWHYGWGPAVSEIKSIDKNYDRVFISMSGEPAWIFFAAWYEYPPELWQKEFPVGRDVDVPGFGKISHTGKYYFGSPDKSVQIYGLGRYLTSKDLYLANATEDGDDLSLNPGKAPPGLKLLKTVLYPSGIPAFYLFTGTN